jgi:hypothetical protein
VCDFHLWFNALLKSTPRYNPFIIPRLYSWSLPRSTWPRCRAWSRTRYGSV